MIQTVRNYKMTNQNRYTVNYNLNYMSIENIFSSETTVLYSTQFQRLAVISIFS